MVVYEVKQYVQSLLILNRHQTYSIEEMHLADISSQISTWEMWVEQRLFLLKTILQSCVEYEQMEI